MAANEGATDRIGTITVGGEVHTITQVGTGEVCAYELEPITVTVGALQSDGEIQVIATAEDCPWTATSNSAWVTITEGASGSGNGTVRYTVSANTSAVARRAIITVGNLTHTINQIGLPQPPGCINNISLSNQEFEYLGDTGQIDITASSATCQWTAQSDVDWIGFSNENNTISGTGSNPVTFYVFRHYERTTRTGHIAVNGQQYTITQTGLPSYCTYQISPMSNSFSIYGGTSEFQVIAPGNCVWRAVSSDPDWIVLTSGTVGDGNGIVNYRVEPNGSFDSRNGTITAGGQSYSITQQGQPR